MSQAVKLMGFYSNTKYLQTLTAEHLHIPGVRLFGKQIRTSATEALPLHFHENCYEVVYISSGTPNFYVNGENYNLCGGDVFITKPFQEHSTHFTPVSISEMYWLILDIEGCNNFMFLDRPAIRHLNQGLSRLHSPKITTDEPLLKKLLQNAFEAALTEEKPQLVSSYLVLLLNIILECSRKTAFKLTPDIGKAVNYILDHVCDNISLDFLATVSYLSTSQFKQKFKNQMGIASHQFINTQKIEYAKQLLLEGLSVQEIAAILHFDNSAYFSTVFKRHTSYSPRHYLEKIKEKSQDIPL